MEQEKPKGQNKAGTSIKNGATTKLEISNLGLNSKTVDATNGQITEVPNIRLLPEQIEEIHTDEYSLTLFYATRIAPMSTAELKRDFPEPEPKKAQSVMDRYVKAGLVHITSDGKYYSNYPENYINYSHYRYDNDLEARKDSKVFRLMKEFTGNKEYWKDKTYFSMDAFYSDEQTAELLEMFLQVKLKAKHYANENAKKKSTKGLKFRRIKFYDMKFALILTMFLSLFGMMKGTPALAGGNDPITRASFRHYDPQEVTDILRGAKVMGGGNDPTTMSDRARPKQLSKPVLDDGTNGPTGGGGHDPTWYDPNNGGHDPNPPRYLNQHPFGGGGHDPVEDPLSCVLDIEGRQVPVRTPEICRLKLLIDFVIRCGQSPHPTCVEANRQVEELLRFIGQHGGLITEDPR